MASWDSTPWGPPKGHHIVVPPRKKKAEELIHQLLSPTGWQLPQEGNFPSVLGCACMWLICLPWLEGKLSGFPGSLDGKESTCNAGDPGSIPGLGRSPGEGNGNPIQYSYLDNPMDRGACQAIVHRAARSQTQLSN